MVETVKTLKEQKTLSNREWKKYVNEEVFYFYIFFVF